MRLLDAQTNELVTYLQPLRTPVSYSALMLRITGTSDVTGVFIQDFGRFQYRIRGNTIVDMDIPLLNAFDNIGGGIPEATGLGAGAQAFAVSVLIPRNYFDDNVEMITPSDNAEVVVQFGPNIQAHVAANFLVELYAIEEFGISGYHLLMRQNEENIAGAGSIPSTVNYCENICAIYISDIPGGGVVRTLVASLINRIRYTVGNKFTGDFSLGAGLAKTNLNNRVEAAQSLMCEVFAAKVGDISSMMEDQAQLTFVTTGLARAQIIVLGKMFNPNKLSESANQSVQRLNDALATKDATGKKRTAATVRAIVGAPS